MEEKRMGESLQAEYKLAAQDMRAIEEGFSKERSYTEALKAAAPAGLIEKQLQNAKVCMKRKQMLSPTRTMLKQHNKADCLHVGSKIYTMLQGMRTDINSTILATIGPRFFAS